MTVLFINAPDDSLHHSTYYTSWFNPHYHIVSRNIYEKYLRQKIEGNDTAKVYEVNGVIATYPGGRTALKDDLAENYGEPEPILYDWCGQWVTLVSAIVEKDGSLSNIEIFRAHDKYFDHHALMAVRSLKKFIPASINGESVRSKIIIPVRFAFL